MNKLLTMRQILTIEIDYRINVLKMPKRKTAVSLGYSERSFRYIYERLKTDPECSIRLPNEGERKLESRAYEPRRIYKRKEE